MHLGHSAFRDLTSQRFVRTDEIGGTHMGFALEFILRFSQLLMNQLALGDVLKNSNERNHFTMGIATGAFYCLERPRHTVQYVYFFGCPRLA